MTKRPQIKINTASQLDIFSGAERMARIDLGCMWVSGGILPDHAIIGRFINLHMRFSLSHCTWSDKSIPGILPYLPDSSSSWLYWQGWCTFFLQPDR